MPRDAVLLSVDPVLLTELGQMINHRPERLGVQGIDRGGSAAVLRPDGRLVCAVQAPVRIETVDEIERLLPDAPHDVPVPCFWHDAWIAGDADRLGRGCLEALASMTRGVLVLAEPLAPGRSGAEPAARRT